MQKILLSLLTIILVSVVAVGATRAYFSDTKTSTGNSFTAGTMNLKLNGTDGVTATWAMSNMKPGDLVSASINLTNPGSIDANHVEVSVANAVTDVAPTATNPLDQVVQITSLNYGGADILSSVSDSNGNGYKDLDDLQAGLDNLSAPAPLGASTKTLAMTVQFRADAGNEYQGDSDAMTMTFVLNQDSSQ